MNKKEAVQLLINHTQYFVSNDDLEALYMAIEALQKEITDEDKEY